MPRFSTKAAYEERAILERWRDKLMLENYTLKCQVEDLQTWKDFLRGQAIKLITRVKRGR
jgi:hypothetical protein